MPSLVIGALVLIIAVGFVAVMMISEWGGDGTAKPALAPSPGPAPRASKQRANSRRKPAKKKK
jgi:hypothetical protein